MGEIQGLYRDYQKQEKEEKRQEMLHEKYHVEDQRIKVVEKPLVGKFIIRMLGIVISVIARLLLVILAAIGIISLIYPETREALMNVYEGIRLQFRNLTGY